jgi:hypothetical protein
VTHEPFIEADTIGEPVRMPYVKPPRNRHAENRKVYGVSAAGHIVAAKGYTNDGAEILGPGRRPPRRPQGPPGEEGCLSAIVHPSQERALVVSGRFGETRVFEIDLESGGSTLLFDHPNARAAYVGDELLVCLADGTLTLSRFRPEDEAPVTLGSAPAPGNTLLTVLHDRGLVITDGSDDQTLSTRLFAASGEGLELVGRLTLNGPQPEKLIFCSSWQDTGERIVFSADRVGFQLRPTDHPSLAGLSASESEPVSAPEKEPPREPGAVRDTHLHPLGQKVASLHGNGDEEVRKRPPKWKDVEAEFAHLEAGRRRSVWLFLDDGGQDRSPHLAVIREEEDGEPLLLLEYGSFDCDLSAGARTMNEVRAVFRHFFDEKELRAEDGWEYV